jgi:hypothetical protein
VCVLKRLEMVREEWVETAHTNKDEGNRACPPWQEAPTPDSVLCRSTRDQVLSTHWDLGGDFLNPCQHAEGGQSIDQIASGSLGRLLVGEDHVGAHRKCSPANREREA